MVRGFSAEMGNVLSEFRAVQGDRQQLCPCVCPNQSCHTSVHWQPSLITDSQQSAPDPVCGWKQSGCICLAEFHCSVITVVMTQLLFIEMVLLRVNCPGSN